MSEIEKKEILNNIREALNEQCRTKALDDDNDFEEVIKVIEKTLNKDLYIAHHWV